MAQNSNSHKKSSKSLKESAPPPLPFAHHLKENLKENKKDLKDDISVDDALKMLENMKEMHDKIDHLIDKVLSVTGWSKRYLESYLNNPSNFKDSQKWADIQKQRKDLMNSIKTPQEIQKDQEKEKNSTKKPLNAVNHDPKIAKERRTKVAGQRRNWLPMR